MLFDIIRCSPNLIMLIIIAEYLLENYAIPDLIFEHALHKDLRARVTS